MPITQDRLINLVAYADVLLSTIDELQDQTRRLAPLAEAVSNANSALAHRGEAADERTRQVIRDLRDTVTTLHNFITGIHIPVHLREKILEEKIHFSHAKNRNERMMNYKRAKANARADARTGGAASGFTDINDQAEVLATVPSVAPLTRAETMEITAKRIAALPAPPSGHKPMAQRMAEREAAPAAPAAQPMRTIMVNGEEVRTSAPPAADLAAPAFPPGQDIFGPPAPPAEPT
jgi:hypothetical protein